MNTLIQKLKDEHDSFLPDLKDMGDADLRRLNKQELEIADELKKRVALHKERATYYSQELLRRASICLLLLIFGAGCMTTARQVGVDAASALRPEHAGKIAAINALIPSTGGKPTLEGYVYERIWYYDGRIVPASSISWEDRYSRKSDAVAPPAILGKEDSVLRDRINALAEKLEGIAND